MTEINPATPASLIPPGEGWDNDRTPLTQDELAEVDAKMAAAKRAQMRRELMDSDEL